MEILWFISLSLPGIFEELRSREQRGLVQNHRRQYRFGFPILHYSWFCGFTLLGSKQPHLEVLNAREGVKDAGGDQSTQWTNPVKHGNDLVSTR